MAGDREQGALPGLLRGAQVLEMLPDEALNPSRVELAHRDDGHEVGAVPVVVEAPQGVVGERLQHGLFPDGQPQGVAGILKENGELAVAHAALGAPAQPPLLDDDAALLVDLRAFETDAMGPVRQNLETLLQHAGAVGGHLQDVDGLIETGVGVQIGPEAHADGLQVVHQFLAGEVGCAVESHVLGEVGQPLLVVVLQHGASIDDEAELGPLAGFVVHPDEIAQTVVQDTGVDPGIVGKGLFRGGEGLAGEGVCPVGRERPGTGRPEKQGQQGQPGGDSQHATFLPGDDSGRAARTAGHPGERVIKPWASGKLITGPG